MKAWKEEVLKTIKKAAEDYHTFNFREIVEREHGIRHMKREDVINIMNRFLKEMDGWHAVQLWVHTPNDNLWSTLTFYDWEGGYAEGAGD